MERHVYDQDVVGCVQQDIVFWSEKGYGQWFWSEEDLAHLRKDGEKLLDTKNARSSVEETKKAVEEYWSQARTLLSTVESKGSPLDLANQYEKYSYALRRVYAHFNTSVAYTTFSVESRLKEIILKATSNDVDSQFILLTSPEKPDLLSDELIAWLSVLKNPTDEAILLHARRYPISLANVLSESAVIKWGRDRIAASSLQEIEDRIREADKRRRELKLNQEKILAKLASREAEELSWFLRESTRCRLLVKNCWNGEVFLLLPFFKKIASLGECSVKDAYFFYTRPEVMSLLRNKVKISGEELRKRKKACLLLFSAGKIELFSGKAALDEKKQLLGDSLPAKDVLAIRGTIANRGKVSGKARIIRTENPNEIRLIANSIEGDCILVAGMTNPTMIPLFSKVKGIITDEGGATCHAAVLSREFGLPCIVGCKIATLILKDGEDVLLDATAGVVRRKLGLP